MLRLFSDLAHPQPSRRRLIEATVAVSAVLVGVAVWAQSRLGAALLPHAFCITASQPLLWLHLVSDSLIAFAYLLIPWTIINFIRQRPDMPFGWVAWLFGAFIVACGITHALEVWTLWVPVYWYSGVMKAFTAAVSLATAWLFYMLTPKALALPSAAELREVNQALQAQVAARLQAEAELRTANAKLEALLGESQARAAELAAVLDRFFEAAPLGMAMVGADGRLLRANRALLAMAGPTAGEPTPDRADALPGAPPQLDAALEDAARGAAPLNLEHSHWLAGGREVHLRSGLFPIRLRTGELLVGWTVQDETYRKTVERERQVALSNAREANHAKDQFLARVSHELRSPLQVALLSTEVLRRTPDLPQAAAPLLARLSHAVGTQARMIDDLIDVSRILSGKLHLQHEALDPAEPLAVVAEHRAGLAAQRGIVLDTAGVRPGQARVQADRTRLEQVCTNLIDNAIRFSPDGGRIALATERHGSAWCFSVADQGPGMAAPDLERLFEPFAQGKAQPSRGKGLGLGLAIVKGIVEALGGRVRARSDGPGTGTTFSVELPVLAGHPARDDAAPGHAEAAPDIAGLRLLYVEDEAEVAQMMGAALQARGAEVAMAASRDEAAGLLRRHRFDCVISDLDLGDGGSGYEVALDLPPGTPLIALSAYGTREDRDRTREAGFRLHLVKPVDTDAVARAVVAARAQD